MPATAPPTSNLPPRPPWSPAIIDSAAATPGGQAAGPGNNRESKNQYSMAKSISIAGLHKLMMPSGGGIVVLFLCPCKITGGGSLH
jgi:hypothetical protein